MRRKISFLSAFLLCFVVSLPFSAAQKRTGDESRLRKETTDTDLGYFDANRIFSYLENDGTIVTDDFDGNSGMYWPSRASGKTVNYCSGLWVAGKIDGKPVTACAEYSSEWAPGKILYDGTPDDKDDPKYQL